MTILTVPKRNLVKPGPWRVRRHLLDPEWRWAWEGLVGAWPMWRGQGHSVAGVSPYRTDGEFNGDPEWDVSTRGHAVRLDGSGDYLEVPETERFNFTSGPFTLVCLFRRAATGSRHTLLAN